MEKQFAKGFYPKKRREGAPDFVLGKMSVNRIQALEWLSEQTDEWINLDLKEGKSGKCYAEVDTWKPEKKEGDQPAQEKPADDYSDMGFSEDIPF